MVTKLWLGYCLWHSQIKTPEQCDAFPTILFSALRSFKSEARGCEEPKNRSRVSRRIKKKKKKKPFPVSFIIRLSSPPSQPSSFVVPSSLVRPRLHGAHPVLPHDPIFFFPRSPSVEHFRGTYKRETVNVWRAAVLLVALTVDVIIIVLVSMLIAVDRWDMSSLLWCVWQKSPQGS